MGFGLSPTPSTFSLAGEADSGFHKLSADDWCSALRVLASMGLVMEDFLAAWTQRMLRSGYLSFTTAKRTDCIASCEIFLAPILKHGREGFLPTFELLRDKGTDWAQGLVSMGMRHWRRGVHGALFLGCFKNFILALEDALMLLPARNDSFSSLECSHAVTLVQIYAAAFEVIWLENCMEKGVSAEADAYESMCRMLTLEKCRFENILNTTSDCVLVMDAGCLVTAANRAVRQYAGENVTGRPIWEVLGLEGRSPEEFFRYYPAGQTVEVAPFSEDLVFRLSISSFADVSLASAREYLVLLTNITPHAMERELMEKAIRRHTADLVQEKERLEEMNITLRNVLNNVEKTRERDRKELTDELFRFLGPALNQLAEDSDSTRRAERVRLIREQAERILAGGSAPAMLGKSPDLRKLTLSELKVCQLIQEGRSSKEVAEILKISPETVQTHRKNIRRKLGVKGHGEQLSVYLMAGQEQRG
jgi:DNA-binding CsgD family transcriptional regulator